MRNTWFCFNFGDNEIEIRRQMSNINQSIRLQGFRPMSHDEIHLTAIFCGQKLKGVNKDRLAEINTKILNKIHATPIRNTEFQFDRFAYFPPEKKNLIVAIYKPNKELLKLIESIKKEIKEYCDSDLEFWPHITMGKLETSQDSVRLPNLLNSIRRYPDFMPNSIVMSGDKIKYIDHTFILA